VDLRRLLLVCLLLAPGQGALAARLEVPLRVPLELVREALAKQLADASGKTGDPTTAKTGDLWREGGCRYLHLEPPTLEAAENGHLRLVAPGKAALGAEVLGKCANAADWVGTARFLLAPRIDQAGVLRVRVVDSALVDERGDKAAALIWELGKSQIQPRLERFGYDLGAWRTALAGILRDVAPPEQAAAMAAALKGLQVRDPRIEPGQVVVPLALEIPDAWRAPASPLPPSAGAPRTAPLTDAESEALEKALEPLDAFLVYCIRQIASDGANAELRQKLFTLLLDSRYQLSDILSGDVPSGGDPVRALFLDTWSRLRSVLADGRYALFVDAGDALLALDQAAPSLGIRISADGLRQLARSLRPGEAGDPLAYDWKVDPKLLELFHVEELPEKTSSLGSFLRVADAAPDAPRPLDRWVPSRRDLPLYEARIGDLLAKSAAVESRRAALPAPYDRMFANIVPTTALIESCWHQYVVRAGKVTYLRSQSRSIGIMQINQHVWRGFYDVERLRWSTAYNIHAGTQILLRYVKDYAIPYAQKSGNPADVPRAAYAVYNAGPRAVGRFAKSPPHPREARVDAKLWELYQGIDGGGKPDLESCGVRSDLRSGGA
jgi:hypothetical protein